MIKVLFQRIEEPTQGVLERPAGAREQRLPELERLIGSKVEDEAGEDIGRVECFWEDDTRQAAYIGVRTGWLGLGAIHVVPADAARFNPGSDVIRVPFAKDVIKNAPAYDPEDELDSIRRREIFDYYNSKGGKYSQPGAETMYQQEQMTTAERERIRAEKPLGTREEVREGEEVRVPLHEEKLSVGKEQVESGGVKLRKVIRTEVVQQPVELRHEELVVERGPATETRPGEKAFETEEFYIPLRSERAVVQKEVVTTGEVKAQKKATVEKATVSEKLRKEEIETQRGTETTTEKKP